MNADTLFMLRLEADRARLFQLARARSLRLHAVDLGYVVHTALRTTFGENAPQPFTVRDGAGRRLVILGYGSTDAPELAARARECADPLAYAVFPAERLLSKPMPQHWEAGRDLRFEVRACPVIRTARPDAHRREGAEIDAFLQRCSQKTTDEPLSREVAYVDWLRDQLQRHGGAELLTARMERFTLARLSRRTHDRRGTWSASMRPDVTLRGTLRITNDTAFRALLARGIGRHRAFAFGMLLLSR